MNHDRGALISWYKTATGAKFAALEQQMITRVVKHLRPFRCLELAHEPLVDAQWVKQKINVSQRFTKKTASVANCVVGDVNRLPFMSGYFDLIVCCHEQEVNQPVGQMIAELSRVLMPGGVLLIIGFNPYGLWRQAQFLGVDAWRKHTVYPRSILALAEACSLVEVYTDYVGHIWIDRPADQSWSGIVSDTMARYTPELGILYKMVFKKQVAAAVGMVDTASMASITPA